MLLIMRENDDLICEECNLMLEKYIITFKIP